MPPPKPPADASPDPESTPPTTRRANAARQAAPSTPANRKHSANVVPRSAPAAPAGGAAAGVTPRKRTEPTLLGDFLLGRQSPARVAAQRAALLQEQRRKSTAALDAAGVEEELRQEMRAGAVRKLQQPGGVKDRVRAWQRNSAGFTTVVDDAISEPTEILVQVDQESVTEEDRIRIKMRQKARKRRTSCKPREKAEAGMGIDRDEVGDLEDIPFDPRLAGPPKKRIVSDDNWMKRHMRKSPPGTAEEKTNVERSPNPKPKNNWPQIAQNLSAHDKVKGWAAGVEVTASTRPKQRKTKSGDTIIVEESPSTIAGSTDGVRVEHAAKSIDAAKGYKATRTRNQTTTGDDGIRIKPTRSKDLPDDGIRVRPLSNTPLDDGIRIRPGPEMSSDELAREASDEEIETPTKRKGATRRRGGRTVSATTVTQTEDATDYQSQSANSDDPSSINDSQVLSERPSTAPGTKNLKDIPVGYSAFSELDLPLGADARNSSRRPKTQRTQSFKAVPNVIKKVVNEGKKIIHDKVDPPKPVANQPRSIESWLNTTVDPFLESPSPKPKRASVEKEWAKESRRRSSSEQPGQDEVGRKSTEDDGQDSSNQQPDSPEITPKKQTPAGAGLKRSRATRDPSSSQPKPSQRKPFREQLKDAFRGESGGHKLPPMAYPSRDPEEEPGQRHEGDFEKEDPRRQSTGSGHRIPSPEPESTIESSLISGSTAPPRRKPPTNGLHELSTIFSEGSAISYDGDELSTISQTTITQGPMLPKSSTISREKSQKSGLKRRLTKHSDLVSVLSLPDDGLLIPPSRTRSGKSSNALHRKSSKLSDATLEELLQGFEDDEQSYRRELKTLVDGVIPVLLTQVVNGDNRSTVDLFSIDTGESQSQDGLAKGVVSMGVALEKLKKFHNRVPHSDAHHLLTWLESVCPIYDKYFDVWHLGFENLVVNLAPAAGRPDDEDSLVNAMPRNEEGDVLDDNGERVDVAYLLKRPLVRIKWMVKFLKGAHQLLGTDDARAILLQYEALQEKARRRFREEQARKTDEDANNTDTARTRDLRNLAPIDAVTIDKTRQVCAKDAFSLDLAHSNGQRLECLVELVCRDNPNVPSDKGDVLIRETGTGGRSWLLFPPIPKEQISARTSDTKGVMVVMIRGTNQRKDWFELLNLSTNVEEQVAEWLEILGCDHTPPSSQDDLVRQRRNTVQSPIQGGTDVPVGERKLRKPPPASHETGMKTPSPSRCHQRNPNVPTTPVTGISSPNASSPSPNKTPTQGSYFKSPDWRPLPSLSSESPTTPPRPEPAKLRKPQPNTTPYREDGAPPPPLHRTLTPKSPLSLSPPKDTGSGSRVKRRTSSPLKHEYHPSDFSDSSANSDRSDSDFDSDSSSDELDELDIPDTVPAISIKKSALSGLSSVVSDNSLTPSNSASQSGLQGFTPSTADYAVSSIAYISYWSNKRGTWKDVSAEPCSIAISPGLIEAYPLSALGSSKPTGPLASSGSSDRGNRGADAGAERPLIALDLTPLVMIRKSTMVDLEIRSPVRTYAILSKIDGAFFRFRAPSAAECQSLYDAVHQSRMNNAKFRALEEESRFRSFGQQQQRTQNQGGSGSGSGDGDSSTRRRSWFGRKNSYRAGARAPSQQSGGSSSGVSASSFLQRLTGGSGGAFNIGQSTLSKQSSSGASSATGAAAASLYTSSASSSGGPRSPSVSHAKGAQGPARGSTNLPIRCHLQVNHKRWEDHGNCVLDISRPPQGVHQELRLYHGMEKRIVVRKLGKKEGEPALIVLDVVLGSGCFSKLGSKGVVLNVWEDLRDGDGNVGVVPAIGGLSGRVKKWCFQCPSQADASWIISLVTQEVFVG